MIKFILSWYLELSVSNLLSYFQFVCFLKLFLILKCSLSCSFISSSTPVIIANKTGMTELVFLASADKSRVRCIVIMLARSSTILILAFISSPIIVGECVHCAASTQIVDLFLVPVELSDEGASVVYLVFDEQLCLHILVLR